MRENPVHDVSSLPEYGFGPSSTTWWGTLGFVAIEGTGFLLAGGVYFYLAFINRQWPLSAEPPRLGPGTWVLIVLLVSLIPNWFANKAGEEQRLGATRLWLVVMTLLGIVPIVIRFYEFSALAVRWDDNAYGSIVWVLLGLHTLHLITDVGDTLILTALMFTRHGHGKRFSDVVDNAFYWYFVVGSWVALYALIYWIPRL